MILISALAAPGSDSEPGIRGLIILIVILVVLYRVARWICGALVGPRMDPESGMRMLIWRQDLDGVIRPLDGGLDPAVT